MTTQPDTHVPEETRSLEERVKKLEDDAEFIGESLASLYKEFVVLQKAVSGVQRHALGRTPFLLGHSGDWHR